MEIQPQPTAGGGTAAAGGSANTTTGANGTAGRNAFLTTLTGMLVGDANQAGSETKAGTGGLGSLIQWLTPLMAAASVTNQPSMDQQKGQIDGLIQMLEQSKQQEDVEALLSNPDLQAWLAQFIPLMNQVAGEPANGSEGSAAAKVQLMSSGEVMDLLKRLKAMLAGGVQDPGFKQAMKELPAVLLSAASASGEIHKQKNDIQQASQTALLSKSGPDSANSSAAPLVQPVSNPLHKLEALASTHYAIKLNAEQGRNKEEAPLFEPLNLDTGQAGAAQPITMHDFMKHVQNGQMIPKTASLQMPASSFASDMAQLVVNSFVLGTSSDGVTEAKISLYPQHLGHVEVKLTMQNGHLVAQFVADSSAGKEMLEGQLAQLRNTLQIQGIQVDKLEVSQSQSYQSGMFQEGRQQQSQQSSKQKNSGSGKIEALEELGETKELATVRGNRTADDGSIDVMA